MTEKKVSVKRIKYFLSDKPIIEKMEEPAIEEFRREAANIQRRRYEKEQQQTAKEKDTKWFEYLKEEYGLNDEDLKDYKNRFYPPSNKNKDNLNIKNSKKTHYRSVFIPDDKKKRNKDIFSVQNLNKLILISIIILLISYLIKIAFSQP